MIDLVDDDDDDNNHGAESVDDKKPLLDSSAQDSNKDATKNIVIAKPSYCVVNVRVFLKI